jgi:hypothetical protein
MAGGHQSHQCVLGGAGSHHASSGRRKLATTSPTATFPTNVMLDSELNCGDGRIWKEGDPWATMTCEYYQKNGDGWAMELVPSQGSSSASSLVGVSLTGIQLEWWY